METSVLELQFQDKAKKTHRISIVNPILTLQKEQAEELMKAIVSHPIFINKYGLNPYEVGINVRYVKRTVTVLVDNE